MKVCITGGTGFIGTSLVKSLTSKEIPVTIITRSISGKTRIPEGAAVIEGDPRKPGSWQDDLRDFDAVINLAGASIFQRWSERNKKNIRESRILTTRNIVAAVSLHTEKKIDLINASAVGYYGYHGDELLDERTPPGEDFLATVAREWEEEALRASALGARVLICRFGIVLGKKGGALGQLLRLFRLGLGAQLGNGKQWFSWIHEGDLSRIILFLLENRDIRGPINCSAPNPVQNREMTRLLNAAVKRPTFIPPVPGFMLRILLGEFAENLLRGQRVIPKALIDNNFSFAYSNFEDALQDIISD